MSKIIHLEEGEYEAYQKLPDAYKEMERKAWFGDGPEQICAILTSCGRWDLLEKTLETFFKFNDYPIYKLLINDDYGAVNFSVDDNKKWRKLEQKFPEAMFFASEKNEGQIKSLDYLMSIVDTPYYFSTECDWETYAPNFIQQSISILKHDKSVINVSLRADTDTSMQKLEDEALTTPEGVKYSYFANNRRSALSGFSFNPSVRRLSDYKMIEGGYQSLTTFDVSRAMESEMAINRFYAQHGFKGAIIRGTGFISHIGGESHISEKHWQK